jgi:hypothetical protein
VEVQANPTPQATVPFYLDQGVTKDDLKCHASALVFSETLKAKMDEKGEALVKREEKRRRVKEATLPPSPTSENKL